VTLQLDTAMQNGVYMLVREQDLVCWESRHPLWDFTSRNLVDSPVTSIVSFEDLADINAGIEDAKPRSSLCHVITLQWEVYIEKTFTDFPLFLQLFDWTRGQSFTVRNSPDRHWLQSDFDKCLLPHGNGSDGHCACSVSCWWECAEIHAPHRWWRRGVRISLISSCHNSQQSLL